VLGILCAYRPKPVYPCETYNVTYGKQVGLIRHTSHFL